MRVLAENFSDMEDSMNQATAAVSTAMHDITPWAPMISSPAAGSLLISGMLLWTAGQWVAGQLGGE
jgi:hypothetical protein